MLPLCLYALGRIIRLPLYFLCRSSLSQLSTENTGSQSWGPEGAAAPCSPLTGAWTCSWPSWPLQVSLEQPLDKHLLSNVSKVTLTTEFRTDLPSRSWCWGGVSPSCPRSSWPGVAQWQHHLGRSGLGGEVLWWVLPWHELSFGRSPQVERMRASRPGPGLASETVWITPDVAGPHPGPWGGITVKKKVREAKALLSGFSKTCFLFWECSLCPPCLALPEPGSHTYSDNMFSDCNG